MAAHRSRRAPLRSDPGVAAGAEPSGHLEADRRQPRQTRAESCSALPRTAPVRLLAADPVARSAPRADLWADGSVRRCDWSSTLRVVRARTPRHRSWSRRPPDPTRLCERTSQAHEDEAQQARRSATGDRARGARPATEAERQSAALPERPRRLPRLSQLQPPPLEARPESSRDRPAARSLRLAPHVCHLRAPRRSPSVCLVAVHGHEHRNDRPPLRPPRRRQPRARRIAHGCARARKGRGRWVDVGPHPRKAPPRHGFQAWRKAFLAGRGRSVDTEARTRRQQSWQKELISRNFGEPSDGLEPSTPSLPFLACFSRFRGLFICHRLPLVAPAGLHKRSILSAQIRDEKTDLGALESPTERVTTFHVERWSSAPLAAWV